MNFRDTLAQEPDLEDSNARAASARIRDITISEEPYGLTDALLSLWRWKFIFIASAALLAALLVWGITMLEPRYTASAKVLVDPREINATGGPPLVAGPSGDPATVFSEMEVIRSAATLRRVVERLGLDEQKDPSDGGAYGAEIVNALRGALGLGSNDAVEPSSVQEARTAQAVEALSRNLRVLNADDSRVIEVRATANSPAAAAAIANAIAEEFIAQQEAFQQNLEASTSRWINRRTTELRESLQLAESAALQHRLETLRLVGSERETIQAQLDALVAVLAEGHAEVARIASERSAARKAVEARGPRALLAFVDSPILGRLAEQAADLELEIRHLAEEHGKTHPRLERPSRLLAATLEEMEAAAALQLAGLTDRLERARLQRSAVHEELDVLRAKLEALDRRLIVQRSLDRDVDTAAGVLEGFATRLRQTESSSSEATLPRLVSLATPPIRPSQPRRAVLAVVAVLVAAVTSAGGVLLADQRRRGRVWSARDARRSLGLPILGSLPRARRLAGARSPEDLSRLLTDRRSPYDLGPMVASLASALIVLARPRRSGSPLIVVTSPEPGVGQTTVLALAAVCLAQYGQKVLVIDFGSGRESLAARLGARDDAAEAPASTAIEGVQALSLQPRATATLAMLQSGFSGTLDGYDIVLVDAPVVEELAEPALSLAREGRIVLVASSGISTIDSLREAAKQFGREGYVVSSIILNRVEGVPSRGRP